MIKLVIIRLGIDPESGSEVSALDYLIPLSVIIERVACLSVSLLGAASMTGITNRRTTVSMICFFGTCWEVL